MPIQPIIITPGTGTDVTVPNPYAVPEMPQGFHYELTGANAGYLLWKRDVSLNMVAGHFELQRATTYNGTYSAVKNVDNPTTGLWVSTQDAASSAGDWWRLRAVTSSGETSIWTMPLLFPTTTTVCNVLLKIEDFRSEDISDVILTAIADTALENVSYQGYTLIPKPKVSAKVDSDSKVVQLKLIPSADIGNLKYIFELITPEKKVTFAALTVPSTAQANFTELT